MSTEELAKQEDSELEAKPQRFIRPYYEVSRDKEDYLIHVYMPGVNRESVKVVHEKGNLSVEGSRLPYGSENWRPVLREIPDADYRLELELNVHVAEKKITAKAENGILTVQLPVADEAKPRKVQIS